MKKFEVAFVLILSLALAAVLTWGILKVTRDLSIVIAAGVANLSDLANQ